MKVFVNHVDSFTGKTVGKVRENGNLVMPCGHWCVCPQVLSQSVVGASREQGDEEEETGEAASGSGNCYEVVGTLSEGGSAAGKPEWVTEIVEV